MKNESTETRIHAGGMYLYALIWIQTVCIFTKKLIVKTSAFSNNEMSFGAKFYYFCNIYLKPKVTVHFELPNISLLFLILDKLNIAMSCWYPP